MTPTREASGNHDQPPSAQELRAGLDTVHQHMETLLEEVGGDHGAFPPIRVRLDVLRQKSQRVKTLLGRDGEDPDEDLRRRAAKELARARAHVTSDLRLIAGARTDITQMLDPLNQSANRLARQLESLRNLQELADLLGVRVDEGEVRAHASEAARVLAEGRRLDSEITVLLQEGSLRHRRALPNRPPSQLILQDGGASGAILAVSHDLQSHLRSMERLEPGLEKTHRDAASAIHPGIQAVCKEAVLQRGYLGTWRRGRPESFVTNKLREQAREIEHLLELRSAELEAHLAAKSIPPAGEVSTLLTLISRAQSFLQARSTDDAAKEQPQTEPPGSSAASVGARVTPAERQRLAEELGRRFRDLDLDDLRSRLRRVPAKLPLEEHCKWAAERTLDALVSDVSGLANRLTDTLARVERASAKHPSLPAELDAELTKLKTEALPELEVAVLEDLAMPEEGQKALAFAVRTERRYESFPKRAEALLQRVREHTAKPPAQAQTEAHRPDPSPQPVVSEQRPPLRRRHRSVSFLDILSRSLWVLVVALVGLVIWSLL